MKTIITLTMNPAIDKSANVAQVIVERKLYCHSPRFEPGGGGVNVSRAIRKLGENLQRCFPAEDRPVHICWNFCSTKGLSADRFRLMAGRGRVLSCWKNQAACNSVLACRVVH